jgi:hypothetical protein
MPLPLILFLPVALSACTALRSFDPDGEPVPVTAASPERAAALADMRAQAEAGDTMPFPDAFQAEQSQRLALRDEPRSVPEVQAIQTELALIAERRAATRDPREIAALDARAKELRRLALAAQPLRR